MKPKQSYALLALLSLFSLLFNAVFVTRGQVGFATEDISEGANVFVFRPSSRQPKNVLRSQVAKVRTTQKRVDLRERRVRQSILLATTKRPNQIVMTRPSQAEPRQDTVRLAKSKSAEEYVKKAEVAFNGKDWDEAENLYSEARAINPDSQTAKLGLAKLYTARGDKAFEDKSYRNAAHLFNQAIALDPQNADVYASLGETYDIQNERDKAIETYLKALQLDKELTEINAPLGTLYYEKGDLANAEKYLALAVGTGAKDDDLQNLYGETLVKLNRAEDAARAFQAAVNLNQSNAVAHYNLAKIYAGANRQDDAISELQAAVKANNNFKEAYFDLGTLLYNKRQYDEAAKYYQEVLRIDSANNEARLNLADSYRQLGKFSDAANQYQVVAPQIKNVDVYSDYGYVLGKSRFWLRAIDMLKEVVKLDANAYDYTNLAWAYNNAAKAENNPALFEDAKRAAQEAIRLNPNFAPAFYNLGNAQTQTKDYQGAFQSYAQALKLRSNWAEANNNFGVALQQSGDHARAIEEYRKALATKPELNSARFGLGVSLATLNKFKEAEEEIKVLAKYNQTDSANLQKAVEDIRKKRGAKRLPQ